MLLQTACTDLSETLYDKVESGDYGKSESEIATIVGRAYTSLRGLAEDGVNAYPSGEFVFFMSEVASDEMTIPTRVGGDWFDQGVYLELQRHTWTASNEKLRAGWMYGFNGVSSVNAVIYQVEQAGLAEEATRPLMAELRALRAYFYYNLMNLYGNVPISTSYTDLELPTNSSRAEVYSFVEKEILESIDYLPDTAYGRITKNVAYFMLARLYLNSEVFINQPRWEECIAMCEKINGELESDFFTNFVVDNEKSKEIIFSIPYDHKQGTTGNILPCLSFHYEQKWAFSATGDFPWTVNGPCGQPGLFTSYEEKDVRRKGYLEGPQIDLRNGNTIVMPASGNELIYTDEIKNIEAALQNEGVRPFKYETKAGDDAERDNDWVLMRYAEVLLMQAECYVRLGDAATARPFVMQVRERAGVGASTPATITLDFIDQELKREFAFEDHRRTDNIRFGTFFKPWWEKGETPAYRSIFPIPAKEMEKNNKLVQNPGY